MLKSFRDRVVGLMQRGKFPPAITENSTLLEIAIQYPQLYEFVERKYGVKVDAENKPLSLKEFVNKYGLPPAQVLFMEVQMADRMQGVQTITARQGFDLLQKTPGIRILDIREEWEVRICKLPDSRPMSPQLLDEILTEWAKDTPVLVYCHFGVRSLDAATFLADRGFTQVYTLQGGIEAWSMDVDPSLPRYQNAYC